MRMQPHHDLAYSPGDQELLSRTHHANGDICLSADQILNAVGKSEFNSEIGVSITQARNDGRQDFNANHVARGDPDAAAYATALACRGALQCGNRTLQ